jgi:hypothetical protein
VAQNGTLLQRVNELQATCLKLSQIVDGLTGRNTTGALATQINPSAGGNPANIEGEVPAVDSLGGAAASGNPTADTAKARAMNIATPQS